MLLVLASLFAVGAPGGDFGIPTTQLIKLGPDLALGRLINRSWRASPNDRFVSGRPTIVVVHGLNPFHPVAHFAIGERYAEALGARFGDSINIAEWDWNRAARLRPTLRAMQAEAVAQGHALADSLVRAGADPARTQLIGQSGGAIVVTAAARRWWCLSGTLVDHLSLIEPARIDHPMVFETLGAGTAARTVEHFWAPGISGLGGPATYPGVNDYYVSTPPRGLGRLRPSQSHHLDAVRWHIAWLGGGCEPAAH